MLVPLLFVMSKIDDKVMYKISFVPFPSFKGNQREKRIYLRTVILTKFLMLPTLIWRYCL